MATKAKTVLKKAKPAVREDKENEIKKQLIDKAIVSGVIDKSVEGLTSNKMKYCSTCGEILDVKNFHKTRSRIYKDGRLHICEKCVYDLINKYYETYNNLADVLTIICSITNTIVIKEPFEDALKEYGKSRTKRGEIYKYYIEVLDKYIIDNATWTKTNLGFEGSNFASKPFKNCCMDEDLSKIVDNDILAMTVKNEDDEEEDIELTPQQRKKLVKKWGDKEDEDLVWLDQREKSYYETHDIPNDHINKSAVITLCNLELQEFKTLCECEDVKKILDSKSRVLSQTSFSPKKKAKEDAASNALDLGSLIKKREEFSPIINNDPELDDIDKIKVISKALAGALCRTAKIESPMVDEFEKAMKDFTFEFAPSEEDDD